MKTRLFVTACTLAAVALPTLASAQLPTGIRQRAIEIGGIGRYTIFPDEVQTDNVFAGGGRLAYYFLNNLALEGEVSFGVTKPTTTPFNRPDLNDVSHTLWDARLLYNTPQRGRASVHIGAGYGYDGFGRLRVAGVGPRGHGPTGLIGLRLFVTQRVTLRGDVGGLYVIDDQEPRDEANTTNTGDRTPRFEPSIRLGLGILFRNQAATSVVTQTVTRTDTVRIASVDTVYRDRMDAAMQPSGANANAGAGAGGMNTMSSATVVIGVVNFDFDRAEISSDARRILDDIASSMSRPEATRLKLILTGNTDAIGGESYNNRLSERRAESVRAYLATQGHLGRPSDPARRGRGQPGRRRTATPRAARRTVACSSSWTTAAADRAVVTAGPTRAGTTKGRRPHGRRPFVHPATRDGRRYIPGCFPPCSSSSRTCSCRRTRSDARRCADRSPTRAWCSTRTATTPGARVGRWTTRRTSRSRSWRRRSRSRPRSMRPTAS